MSTRRLVALVVFLAVFAMTARFAIDSDTWWHLRTGELVLQSRSVPKSDSFSYTAAGKAWKGASVGWLMQVSLYLVYRWLGPGGLTLLTAVMVTLTYLFLWRAMSGGVFLRAFVIVLSTAAAAVYMAARPYLITLLLAAVSLYLLEGFRRHRSARLWWLPAVLLLWGNSHNGFVVGFILWGIYGLGEGVNWLGRAKRFGEGVQIDLSRVWLKAGLRGRVGHMLLVGLLMLIAVSVNPAGPAVLRYPIDTLSINVLREFIVEWQSPDFQELRVQPFIWLLLLTVGAIGISRRRLALVDFLLVAGFGYLSLVAGRNIALFALAAPVVLTRQLAPVLKDWGERLELQLFANEEKGVPAGRSVLNWLLLALVAAAAILKVAFVYSPDLQREAIRSQYPVEAVDYLRAQRPNGRMFNSYNWGGYLVCALREYPVFVDGRTDLYGDEIIGEWLQVVGAEEGWQEILERWEVQFVLLEPHWPVVGELESEGWELWHEEDLAVIYGR